jgi:hypothetical protein
MFINNMRPSEIDFRADKKQHFFDLSNGEVLQGKADLNNYMKGGAETSRIVKLGHLLRNGVSSEPEAPYERLDVSEWSDDKFRQFGRWLSKVVDPPNEISHSHLSTTVLDNAKALGVGPSRRAIRQTFVTVSLFYQEIGESDAHYVGLFKDWDLDDFVKHIKNVGGIKRPTTADLKAVSNSNPKYPKPDYMRTLFKEIGGLRTLFELAGYPVIDLWDKEDYVDWGVKFMEANNGMVPSSRMADYLSTKKKGPSGSSIRNHFDYIRVYQDEVINTYQESQLEKKQVETRKLDMLVFDLRNGKVPMEIFKQNGEDASSNITYANELNTENLASFNQTIMGQKAENIVLDVCNQIGRQEAIRRYAMLKVLLDAVPYASRSTHINLVRRSSQKTGGTFIAHIKHRYDICPGTIENAALTLGFFDDIWPMKKYLESLKLDDGYLDYYKKIEKVKKVRNGNFVSL